eukprot:TRINITY_DN2143_c0_g1_i1.p2 TRINITY_DN2143_c0_g1~~TRINITY_DN2143_c0_g1_i1.p2  ORF type:complete len:51 (-),score=1.45 TRINITY_DN2143_c0_g1_i1:30-182(-)
MLGFVIFKIVNTYHRATKFTFGVVPFTVDFMSDKIHRGNTPFTMRTKDQI